MISRHWRIRGFLLFFVSTLIFGAFVPTASALGGVFDEDFFAQNDVNIYDPRKNTCAATSSTMSSDIPTAVDVAKDFSLGEDKSRRPVNLLKQLMTDFNLDDFQAAGVVGNFMWESGGSWLPPNVNQATKVAGPPTDNYESGNAYGWAQWDAGRKKAFIDFSVSNGYMASANVSATDAANYAYLSHELTETAEGRVLAPLKSTSTVNDAMQVWLDVFERAGVDAPSERLTRANAALTAYRTGGGVDIGSTSAEGDSTDSSEAGCIGSGSSVGTTQSANFGEVAFPLKGSKSVVKNPGIFHDGTTDQGGHPYTAYDIYASAGTEVVAFASGTVTYVSTDICNDPFMTVWNDKAKLGVTYMHIGSNHIAQGATVQAGDHIGAVASGTTTGGEAGCSVEHLHIDAATDRVRQACSRTGCSIQSHFREIGKELYQAYEALPD